MYSPASVPSDWQGSSTREQSEFTRSQEQKPKKSKVAPYIKETAKRLKAIYEDEGLDFDDPTDEDTLVDRFTVATNLRKKRIEDVFRLIRRAHNVQLCFVVDVTGSMSSHIDGVRASINDIVRKLKATEGAQSMQLAFVAYRDIGNNPHIEVLPFTSSVTDFADWIGRIRTSGGFGDTADVFGGLDTALNDLRWTEECGTKVIFHICDVPCHGREFHQPGTGDNYPAGDPKGRTHKGLFAKVRQLDIQYHFGKIYNTTDVMLQKFSEVYGEPITEFDVKNVGNIRDSVITAVSQSISASVSSSQRAVGVARAVRDYTLQKAEPNWSTIPETKGEFLSYEFPDKISDIINDVPLERKKRKTAIVKVAPHPFGRGAERLAFYGKDVSEYVDKKAANSGTNSSSSRSAPIVHKKDEVIVLKEYLHVGKGMNSAKRYELSNQMQTVAAYLAQKFIADVMKSTGLSKTLKFIKIRTLHIMGETRFMSAEKRFAATDKFVRFSNNAGYNIMESKAIAMGVSTDFVRLVTAFSHWTYKATNRFLMVVDLEGVVARIPKDGTTGVLLTDPAIHCKDRTRYGPMNHGPGGMKNFFSSHTCNDYCKQLGLESFNFA